VFGLGPSSAHGTNNRPTKTNEATNQSTDQPTDQLSNRPINRPTCKQQTNPQSQQAIEWTNQQTNQPALHEDRIPTQDTTQPSSSQLHGPTNSTKQPAHEQHRACPPNFQLSSTWRGRQACLGKADLGRVASPAGQEQINDGLKHVHNNELSYENKSWT
jgi:hypothetical protein